MTSSVRISAKLDAVVELRDHTGGIEVIGAFQVVPRTRTGRGPSAGTARFAVAVAVEGRAVVEAGAFRTALLDGHPSMPARS